MSGVKLEHLHVVWPHSPVPLGCAALPMGEVSEWECCARTMLLSPSWSFQELSVNGRACLSLQETRLSKASHSRI